MSSSGLSSPQVCPDSNQVFSLNELLAVYPNGIATDTIPIDPTTQQMSQTALQSYVNRLLQSGIIPVPGTPANGAINMSDKASADSRFHAKIQTEYCYYESRYLFAMKKFLSLSTSMNTADVPQAKNMLLASKTLNLKVNSILEILGILGDSRTDSTNQLKSQIASKNADIANISNQIKRQYSLISKDNVMIETQKHMIKYTKEKNEHVMNQIALFTIMNAFAIGAIFAIVRQ